MKNRQKFSVEDLYQMAKGNNVNVGMYKEYIESTLNEVKWNEIYMNNH